MSASERRGPETPVAHLASRASAIQVEGNSGCSVVVKATAEGVVVEKSALDPQYSARLKRQIEKQAHCRSANRLPFVRVPRIIASASLGELFSATMEYVYFHDSVTYFSTASRPQIDRIVTMLLEYVDSSLAQCPMTEVSGEVFGQKLSTIESSLQNTEAQALYTLQLQRLRACPAVRDGVEIPLGICHGDLTFSNIMIASDSSAIALIDFLDSFIESPLVDIAKLRQDSLFGWSLLMSRDVGSRARFRQVMRYIDAKILAHFASAAWYRDHIEFFLALNMLRIAPYAKSEAVHRFIIDAINSLRFCK